MRMRQATLASAHGRLAAVSMPMTIPAALRRGNRHHHISASTGLDAASSIISVPAAMRLGEHIMA